MYCDILSADVEDVCTAVQCTYYLNFCRQVYVTSYVAMLMTKHPTRVVGTASIVVLVAIIPLRCFELWKNVSKHYSVHCEIIFDSFGPAFG